MEIFTNVGKRSTISSCWITSPELKRKESRKVSDHVTAYMEEMIKIILALWFLLGQNQEK